MHRSGWSRLGPFGVPAVLSLLVGAMAAVMFATHRAGHWWGDDWALYVRQAQGLLDGHPGRVIDENLFTVQQSRGSAFSPPLYPWGFPLLLVPFVAVVGADLDRLAIVPVLCACVFACCWYALARPRLGVVPALVGTVAVTITPLLLGWTELIQSEWPFLAVTALVLVGIDRVTTSDGLVSPTAPFLPLILVGVGVAAAFSVRREGLAMVPAVAAAQVASLIADRERRWRHEPAVRGRIVIRLLLPHASAAAVVWLLQVMLPSTLVPQYTGTSVRNVWRYARRHVEHLAEVSGLKRPWEANPEVLGNAALGWSVVVLYLLAAAIGVGLALTIHRRRDLHLVVYALVALVIGGSFRVAINRYVCTVAPIVMLLGLVTVATLLGRVRWSWAAPVATTTLLAMIVAGNVANAHIRIDRAGAFADAGQVEWGPTHPDAIAMFDEVMALTDDDDVVAAPKARAMTFATGRLSVQVDEYRPIPDTVPIALVVTETGSDLSDALLEDPADYTLVWRNPRFLIFQPSSAASAATNGAGSSSTASP
jgi:hypothetical protein